MKPHCTYFSNLLEDSDATRKLVCFNIWPIRTDSHLWILNSSSPFFQSQLRHSNVKINVDLEFNLGKTLVKKKPQREMVQLSSHRDSQCSLWWWKGHPVGVKWLRYSSLQSFFSTAQLYTTGIHNLDLTVITVLFLPSLLSSLQLSHTLWKERGSYS